MLELDERDECTSVPLYKISRTQDSLRFKIHLIYRVAFTFADVKQHLHRF